MMARAPLIVDGDFAVEHTVAHIDGHVVAPANESADVLCGTGLILIQFTLKHAARHRDTGGQGAATAAMADESAVVGMSSNGGLHAHISNSHDACRLADETGCMVGTFHHGGLYGTPHIQVQECCVTYSGEGCSISRGRSDIDLELIVITVERADEGMVFRARHRRYAADVVGQLHRLAAEGSATVDVSAERLPVSKIVDEVHVRVVCPCSLHHREQEGEKIE
ncbi:MAG: hypothetical protein J6V87_07800 [Prevotella sp.]|nr:hypothetical protein [Prevotella sp.]